MNKKFLVFILFICFLLARENKNNSINVSRQTVITQAIDLVANTVVGVNVTKIKEQRVNPLHFWSKNFKFKTYICCKKILK